MNKDKFTKGPWVVRSNGHYFDIGPESEHPSVVPVDPVCIGVPFENETDAHLIAAAREMYDVISEMLVPFENETDAHLIAAAREMYDVISEMLVQFDAEETCRNEADYVVIREAKKILAKARGEHE